MVDITTFTLYPIYTLQYLHIMETSLVRNILFSREILRGPGGGGSLSDRVLWFPLETHISNEAVDVVSRVGGGLDPPVRQGDDELTLDIALWREIFYQPPGLETHSNLHWSLGSQTSGSLPWSSHQTQRTGKSKAWGPPRLCNPGRDRQPGDRRTGQPEHVTG